jgi:hypothetical protein
MRWTGKIGNARSKNDYIMNSEITESSYAAAMLSPRPDLGVEQVDDDLLILDRSSKQIHQLNRTASIVWKGLEDGREPKEIVRGITETYDVPAGEAAEDVNRIIEEFFNLRLLSEPEQNNNNTSTTRSMHRDYET